MADPAIIPCALLHNISTIAGNHCRHTHPHISCSHCCARSHRTFTCLYNPLMHTSLHQLVSWQHRHANRFEPVLLRPSDQISHNSICHSLLRQFFFFRNTTTLLNSSDKVGPGRMRERRTRRRRLFLRLSAGAATDAASASAHLCVCACVY